MTTYLGTYLPIDSEDIFAILVYLLDWFKLLSW